MLQELNPRIKKKLTRESENSAKSQDNQFKFDSIENLPENEEKSDIAVTAT